MHEKTLAETSRCLSNGEFSSREICEHLLSRIDKLNPAYNVFISTCDELALQHADEADKRRAGGALDPLLGVPIAHKDIFCTNGVRTSCGSKMLDNFVAPYDAMGKGSCARWIFGW